MKPIKIPVANMTGEMTETIVIKMTPEQKEAVMAYTKKNSINLSGLVRTLLFTHLDGE